MVNTQVRNVAIVGTGLIGASWAAQYLASGLDVIATDPAPNAEANLRKGGRSSCSRRLMGQNCRGGPRGPISDRTPVRYAVKPAKG
jgi:3-hydroxyacyl-CoA dehydrogenase